MKQILKNEFERALKNKLILVSLIIGLGITVSHFILNVLPFYNNFYPEGAPYMLTAFHKWMGGEDNNVQPTLYYLVVPIIISLPYLGTIKSDSESGYIKNVFTRIGKKQYYISKYIVTFVTAGVLSVIPLIVNFLLTAMILPATIPQSSTSLYPIFSYHMMGDLFYEKPYAYLGIYIIIDLIYFGLLTTIGLTVSYISDNKFVVTLSPFILYLIVYAVTMVTGKDQYCPFGFLRPSQPVVSNIVIIGIEMIILLILGGGVFLYVGNKKETF